MWRIAGHRYLETIFLTCLTLGLCLFYSSQDPLFINASFPWIWLLPVLIGVRHGRICALISTAFIVTVMIYTLYFLLFSWDSYRFWLLGGIILVIIYMEYQNQWLQRQFGLNEKANYLDERLESLSRAYGVLRLSHDRLEESLIIKPATFRQAFFSLRQLLAANKGKLDSAIAFQYLDLMAYQVGLNSAALYLRIGKKWDTNPIAYIGDNHSLNLEDVLIKECIATRSLHYLALNVLEENQTSDYLAVIPMKTADDRVVGMLTITSMPFLMLSDENLKALSITLAYIADEVWAAKHAVRLQHFYPDCPAMFATEIYKLTHLWELAKVDSSIIIFELEPSDVRKDVLHLIIQEKRALDIVWERKINDTIIVIVLMPLTQRSMVAGYTERMQELLMKRKKLVLGKSPVLFVQKQLSSNPDPHALLEGVFLHDSV